MRQGYHLTREDRAQIRTLYLDGLAIHDIRERLRISRETVSKVVADIKRPPSGWVGEVCKSGPAGWSPVREELDRRALLDKAKEGDPLALRRLNGYGLLSWWRSDNGQIMGTVQGTPGPRP